MVNSTSHQGRYGSHPSPDLQASFFDVIAPYIFDHPPKYYGSVLDRAYKMDMKEHYPLEYATDVESPEDDDDLEVDVATANDEGGDTLGRNCRCTSNSTARPFKECAASPAQSLQVPERSNL